MNKIVAKVEEIKQNEALHQINFSSKLGNLSLVSLEVELQKSQVVTLGFKPTAVAVAKCENNESMTVSYLNQLDMKICELENGEILTKITALNGGEKLVSIITTDSANKLNLAVGERVVFLVKATDIFVVSV